MTILISVRWNRVVAGLAVICAVLAGCAGGPSEPAPSWLSDYPADSAFYVGIGGSNTGNLAEDREKAAASARADLAAQISAQIDSELDISTRASSTGNFDESVERRVIESVEQNLKSVEVVDSWISEEQGAWVYVRLSKAVWAAIVAKEISDLTLRANAMLQPAAAGGQSEAEDLAVLGRARGVLLSSPWGLTVKDQALGGSGFLVDSIDRLVSERTGALVIEVAVRPARIKFGSDLVVSGTVASGAGRDIGAFPLLLRPAGSSETPVVTEADGSYAATLTSAAIGTGTIRIEVFPDLSAWAIPSEGFPVARSSAEAVVDPILLALSVRESDAEGMASLAGAVNDWVSELPLPAEIVAPGTGDVGLEFAWTVFDFPRPEGSDSGRLANAPYLCEIGAVLTVTRDGGVVLVKEMDPYKDGGLDWNQAHQRSARGLLKQLSEDMQLAEELTAALSL